MTNKNDFAILCADLLLLLCFIANLDVRAVIGVSYYVFHKTTTVGLLRKHTRIIPSEENMFY